MPSKKLYNEKISRRDPVTGQIDTQVGRAITCANCKQTGDVADCKGCPKKVKK